jgi:hypothetical protein
MSLPKLSRYIGGSKIKDVAAVIINTNADVGSKRLIRR